MYKNGNMLTIQCYVKGSEYRTYTIFWQILLGYILCGRQNIKMETVMLGLKYFSYWYLIINLVFFKRKHEETLVGSNLEPSLLVITYCAKLITLEVQESFLLS